MEHGPVDVMVVALGEPHVDGSILAELEKMTAAGIIKVLDGFAMIKGEDGEVIHMDAANLPEEVRAKLGTPAATMGKLFDVGDAETLGEGMVPGSGIIAIAIEHIWAVGLVNAIYDQGAQVAIQHRVPAQEVEAAFAMANDAQ